MNELVIFGIQIFITLSIGVLVVTLFKPDLIEILRDTCGATHSAKFWVRYTQLMMIIAPLVIVIYFSISDANQLIHGQVAYILKRTLLQSLAGEFIGLILVGKIIYRAINTSVENARDDARQKYLVSTNTRK